MFELFEHPADIGIRGIGTTVEDAFAEAAKAMFSIMVKADCIEAKNEIVIKANAKDMCALLVEWLNQIILQKDLKEMFFSDFEVEKIEERKNASGEKEFCLNGKAIGEKINLDKHKVWTEVKAATYSELKVAQENGKWVAQCVVDV